MSLDRDLYYRIAKTLEPVGALLADFGTKTLATTAKPHESVHASFDGDGGWWRTVHFREHGLAIRHNRDSVYNVWILSPEGERTEVYRACNGGIAVGGPQWDYIETVLIPWLQAQVEAQQETDRQKWLQREREAREKLNNDIAAWAAARGPFSVSPPLPSTLDAEWDDIRAVHRRPSS